MEERFVYLNDHFCLEKDASIPVTDRGFLYGEGIFTTIRVSQGRCELFSFHANRLKQQAKALNFDCAPLSEEAIAELIRLNGASEGVWRLKIIASVKEEKGIRSTDSFLATLHPYIPPSQKIASLCVFPNPIDTPLNFIKSLSYLDRLFVRRFAEKRGVSDAIITTREGVLLETGSSNLFWVDGERLYIPHPQLPYLKGVFLQAILEQIKLPVIFAEARMDEIPATACVYMCNAMTHVRPVVSIQEVFEGDLDGSGKEVDKKRDLHRPPFFQRQFPFNPKWEEMLEAAAFILLQRNLPREAKPH